MRETLYCPKCKESRYTCYDKKMINSYGKCSKCLLENDLGHEYNAPTFDCSCGKSYKSKLGLDKHQEREEHSAKVTNLIIK